MAYRVAIASGFYDDTAVWSGGVVPVDGDVVEVPPNFDISVRDARVLGTSPNNRTTIVLWIRSTSTSAGGRIKIVNGGQLTVKGCIAVDCTVTTGGTNWNGLRVEAGGKLTFDASASGGTPGYGIMVGAANSQRAGIQIVGTSNSNRGTIESVPGHSWFVWYTAPSNTTYTYPDGSTGTRNPGTTSSGCNIDWVFGQLTNGGSGNSTSTSLIYHPVVSGAAQLVIEDTKFTSCGNVYVASAANGNNVRFLRNVDTNARLGGMSYRFGGGASVTGQRILQHCVLRGQYQIDSSHANCTIEDNITIHGTPSATITSGAIAGTSAGKATANRNIIYWHTGSTQSVTNTIIGDMTDWLILRDGLSNNNPHYFVPAFAITATVSGCYIEWVPASGTGGNGDIFLTNGTSASNITLRNNIVGAAGGGGTTGNLVTQFTNNAGNARWTVEHNTCWIGPAPGWLMAGEGASDGEIAGTYVSIKSNLVLTNSSFTTAYLMSRDSACTFDDPILDANWLNNATWNTAAGNLGNGFNRISTATPMFSGNLPGTTSPNLNVNPQLVGQGDANGTGLAGSFLKWGKSIDPTLTTAYDVVEKMAAEKAGDISQGFTHAAALAWLRRQYAPTNVALRNRGHDGVTIGAVEGVWPVSSNMFRRYRGRTE